MMRLVSLQAVALLAGASVASAGRVLRVRIDGVDSFDAYGRLPKLVNHLHLPVQHGSDRILMAMKRGYTAMEYKSTIRKLRALRPDISLSTDFIVMNRPSAMKLM